MQVKTNKTFKLPKSMKRMLIAHRGTQAQKAVLKNLFIAAVVAEIDFKNRRTKTEKE